MAKCKYCHADMTPDNLHEDCEEKHQKGMQELETRFYAFILGMHPYEEIRKRLFKIDAQCFLNKADVKKCALLALKRVAETAAEQPYHLIITRAIQIEDLLKSEYEYTNLGTLHTAQKELAATLVKGFYKSYFTEGVSEFHVMKNVHMVTQVQPLGEEKEAAICKEVLDEAKKRKDKRVNSFVEAFINYQSPFLNVNENAKP